MKETTPERLHELFTEMLEVMDVAFRALKPQFLSL